MCTARDFYKKHKGNLSLEIIGGRRGLRRRIILPEVHRPGLALAGFLKGHDTRHLLVFGQVESAYLSTLDRSQSVRRVQALVARDTPALFVAGKYELLDELIAVADSENVPLLHSSLATTPFLNKLTLALAGEFAPQFTCHGSLVEVFGVGMLIQGESSIGKSEAALGLVKRGHRLIADDAVLIKRHDDYLEGTGSQLARYHMDVRGIGIINIATLYGTVCTRSRATVDLVVQLEKWEDRHFYDRIAIAEKMRAILDISIPHHTLPVKPGRDMVVLLETMALNYRLNKAGQMPAT